MEGGGGVTVDDTLLRDSGRRAVVVVEEWQDAGVCGDSGESPPKKLASHYSVCTIICIHREY